MRILRIALGKLPQLFLRLWYHIGKHRRRQVVALMVLMLISAVAEIISLGAVLPFLSVLVAPDQVLARPLISRIGRVLGVSTTDQWMLLLALTFGVAAMMAGAIRIFLLWSSTRVAFGCGAELSLEVYRRSLYQPYPVHIARNSSAVTSGIHKVNQVAFHVLLPTLTLATSILVLFALALTLFAIDPLTATVATSGFALAYALITFFTRRRIRRNSERIAVDQTQVIKALQEGLGAIRDVLLDGTQSTYCEIYRRADREWRRAEGDNMFIGLSPRYAMEAIGMVLIATLAYSLSRLPGGVATALPTLGALAFGAQRLLPTLQQGYSAWTTIAGNQAGLADTIAFLDQPLPEDISRPVPAPLDFRHAIRLDAVSFRYSDRDPWVLREANIVIPIGARVGFVGPTGSGKSTLLDLTMGLLSPTEGALLVDGSPVVGSRVRAWQRSIAHVPQSIYLADITLAENIAFGVPRELIDLERVRLAAFQAQIAGFIKTLPDGYDTRVGERGVRLSGGQRQRIGIARAFYKEPKVLVFDEATSALDTATERSVMEAINGLNRQLTILMIAHRLTTVRDCDLIIEVDNGRIVAQGSYNELCQTRPTFRRLAGEDAETNADVGAWDGVSHE